MYVTTVPVGTGPAVRSGLQEIMLPAETVVLACSLPLFGTSPPSRNAFSKILGAEPMHSGTVCVCGPLDTNTSTCMPGESCELAGGLHLVTWPLGIGLASSPPSTGFRPRSCKVFFIAANAPLQVGTESTTGSLAVKTVIDCYERTCDHDIADEEIPGE